MKRFAVGVLLVVACHDYDFKGDAQKREADAARREAAKTPVDRILESADVGVEYAAAAYARFKGENPNLAKQLAPRLAPLVDKAWPSLAESLRKDATARGTERARGKTPDTIVGTLPGLLDDLAPHAPALAARWAPVKAELASLEQQGYEAERADTRPRVTVWTRATETPSTDEAMALSLMSCIETKLAARWPEIKFIRDFQRPADGAHLQLVVKTASDSYRSTKGERTAMLAAAEATLVPSELPAAMAKVFAHELVATGTSRNPNEIKSDLGVTPTVETARAGMAAIEIIEAEVCGQIERQIERQIGAPKRT